MWFAVPALIELNEGPGTRLGKRAAAFALGFVVLASLAAPGSAAVQSPKPLPDTVDAYGIVFDQWVKDTEPKTAILAVRRGGKTVFAKGYGADPWKPTLIASLSKAITGACIATLVRDGKLSFTTPLRDTLPQFFKQYGAPIDSRLNDATVEELLVHRAGLRGNADDDSIYGIFAKRASSGHGWQAAPKAVLSEYLLKDRQGVVVQREVGTDVPSAAAALRSVSRQDVDVLVIGDLADPSAARLVRSSKRCDRKVRRPQVRPPNRYCC